MTLSKLKSVHCRMASFWINYHMWRAVIRYDLPTAAPCCSNRPDTPDPRAQWPGNWVDPPARSLQTPLGGTGRWIHGTKKKQTQEIWCINIHTVYSTYVDNNKQQKSSEVLFLSGWGCFMYNSSSLRQSELYETVSEILMRTQLAESKSMGFLLADDLQYQLIDLTNKTHTVCYMWGLG